MQASPRTCLKKKTEMSVLQLQKIMGWTAGTSSVREFRPKNWFMLLAVYMCIYRPLDAYGRLKSTEETRVALA